MTDPKNCSAAMIKLGCYSSWRCLCLPYCIFSFFSGNTCVCVCGLQHAGTYYIRAYVVDVLTTTPLCLQSVSMKTSGRPAILTVGCAPATPCLLACRASLLLLLLLSPPFPFSYCVCVCVNIRDGQSSLKRKREREKTLKYFRQTFTSPPPTIV